MNKNPNNNNKNNKPASILVFIFKYVNNKLNCKESISNISNDNHATENLPIVAIFFVNKNKSIGLDG
jgi:hypothetical protein